MVLGGFFAVALVSKSFLVNVRLSRREVSQFDSLVSRGVYKSRSDALRGTSELGLGELQKKLAIEELNCILAKSRIAEDEPSDVAGRKARNALWADYLKKAGGDEDKALEMLAFDSNEGLKRFRK